MTGLIFRDWVPYWHGLSFCLFMAQTQLQTSIYWSISLSALISWFMKSIIRFWNNSNLHARNTTSFIINVQWVKKIYFAILEEIYNSVVPHWSVVLISCNHSITRLISFTKNASNQRSILSVCGPGRLAPGGCVCIVQLCKWSPSKLWWISSRHIWIIWWFLSSAFYIYF